MTSQDASAPPSPEFADQVADAYEHLHDLVALRTHPLLEHLIPCAGPPAKRARRLHDLLRDLIDELDPGAEAPSFSTEWRRHRYMVLRYLRGLTHQAVAEQLAIGLRQYYRIRNEIIAEIADILWARRSTGDPAELADEAISGAEPESQLALLRLEAARLAQVGRYARVDEVLAGVAELLEPVMRQRGQRIVMDMAAPLPPVPVQRDLMRQMLVSVLGLLTERTRDATLRVVSAADGAAVRLTISIEPAEPTAGQDRPAADERLSELQQLLAISDCHALPLLEHDQIVGFELHMPIAHRTVLLVDDNEGVLHLFTTYLTAHGYRVLTASTSASAIEKAEQFLPFAITLDLMMPHRDGWETLQILSMRPSTCQIPIIVCSVLKQRELALSLGATAYLEKPVTEQALIAALEALEAAPER